MVASWRWVFASSVELLPGLSGGGLLGLLLGASVAGAQGLVVEVDDRTEGLVVFRPGLDDLVVQPVVVLGDELVEAALVVGRPGVDQAGPDVYASVGAYHLEGLGPHLMSRIEGDFYSILGLPLLAVLDFLRTQGALRA